MYFLLQEPYPNLLVQAPSLNRERLKKMKGTKTGETAQGPNLCRKPWDEPQQANSADGLEATRDFPRPKNLSASRIRERANSLKYSIGTRVEAYLSTD